MTTSQVCGAYHLSCFYDTVQIKSVIPILYARHQGRVVPQYPMCGLLVMSCMFVRKIICKNYAKLFVYSVTPHAKTS